MSGLFVFICIYFFIYIIATFFQIQLFYPTPFKSIMSSTLPSGDISLPVWGSMVGCPECLHHASAMTKRPYMLWTIFCHMHLVVQVPACFNAELRKAKWFSQFYSVVQLANTLTFDILPAVLKYPLLLHFTGSGVHSLFVFVLRGWRTI